MLSTTSQLNDHTPNGSDSKNSHLMDDLEAGILYHQPRALNKKMKKRKQLDALLKFRPSTSKTYRTNSRLSNENLLTSEDELFLPDQNSTPKKPYSSSYRRWCNYTRHILSFCFVCIFMIACVGLAYANIELKNEVQNLSSRVSEIEKRFSTFEINRVLSTIEQIKTRLNVIERWNVSYLYDRLYKLQIDFLRIKTNRNPIQTDATEMSMNDDDVSSKLKTIEQKSKEFSDVANELEKLSRDADHPVTDMNNKKSIELDRSQIEYLLEHQRRVNSEQDTHQLSKNILSLNESFYANSARWQQELNSLRNELQTSNQSLKIQELNFHFEQLTSLMQNSSSKTSVILTALQSDLNHLRTQIEACSCSNEPIHLKPSVVDSNQLQQSLVTKPNAKGASTSPPPPITTLVSKDFNIERKQTETINHNNTIDVAQIVNQPLATG